MPPPPSHEVGRARDVGARAARVRCAVGRRSGSPKPDRGPFLADPIRSGDPYELSRGNPIHGAPTGGRGSGPNALGASVVGWDPAVDQVGVDTGYSPEPDMLRAPDVAVGNRASGPCSRKGASRGASRRSRRP